METSEFEWYRYVKEVSLSAPDIGDAEKKAILDVLDSRHLSIGPRVKQFEELVAGFVGVDHAVATSSGTSALHLCVRASGLREGDEVITSPFSFVASSNCLLYEGVKPVFVDIDPKTFNMDPANIEEAVSDRTKGVLPVHVFGLPTDMDTICDIARSRDLVVIEDACEALGATCGKRVVGSIGDCGVFGFYPNKQITTGEGGIITTDNELFAEECRSMRNQGRSSGSRWLAHERLGFNYRLSELHSALGVVQMQRIEQILTRRKQVAALYLEALRDVSELVLPINTGMGRRSWFVFVVLLNSTYAGQQRDRILDGLGRKGIQCSNYFPPIHLQPYYRESFGFKPGDFPVAESVSSRTLALPFHNGLTEDDIMWVSQALIEEIEAVGAAA